MVAVRYAAGMVAVLCLVITFVTLTVDGVTVLGTLAFGVWLWTFGVFTRDFWIADAETSARLSAVDESLDFEESVLGDLSHLNDENGR